jgi:hypothetical protein
MESKWYTYDISTQKRVKKQSRREQFKGWIFKRI